MKQIAKHMDEALTRGLEESEATYWSKYYTADSPMRCYSRTIAGAFAGAAPDQDILAMNRVIGLGMYETVRNKHIDDIIRFYRQSGARRFFIQLSPYVKQDNIVEILKGTGFHYRNKWVKLLRYRDIPLPDVQSELSIKKISREQAHTYGKLIYDCFDWEDQRLIIWLSSTVGKEGYSHYLAYHQGKAVAAAALHCMAEYASMAFAGTLPEYRGMGAQSLLLKTRILEALNEGCMYFVSETAEEKPGKTVASYRNMRRFGFEEAYLRENWIYEF